LRELGVDPRIFFAFDETLGWIPHAYLVGRNLIEKEGIDCILASHPPASDLIIGCMLSMKCGVSLVLDYRDPWNSDRGIVPPSSLHRSLEMSVENAVLMRSQGIITVCDTVRNMLLEDFPNVREKRLEIVRNGFLSDILEAEAYNFADHKIRILHAGSIYGVRISRMLKFLEGLAMLCNEISSLPSQLEVILTGHVPGRILDRVREANLDSVVRIMTNIPRQEVWGYMKSVEYLLCIPESSFALTSKIFEYVAVGKPIVNIEDENGEAARLISRYGIGSTVRSDPREIAIFLKGLLRVPLTIEGISDVSHFSRERQTEKLAMFLNAVIERRERRA
jgi:glycosyltransferase involved in cell wall biosynthesis